MKFANLIITNSLLQGYKGNLIIFSVCEQWKGAIREFFDYLGVLLLAAVCLSLDFDGV